MSGSEESADEAAAAGLLSAYFGLVDRQATLASLEMLANLVVQVDEWTVALVKVARAEGKTWDQIGRRLGITRQTAYMRYHAMVTR